MCHRAISSACCGKFALPLGDGLRERLAGVHLMVPLRRAHPLQKVLHGGEVGAEQRPVEMARIPVDEYSAQVEKNGVHVCACVFVGAILTLPLMLTRGDVVRASRKLGLVLAAAMQSLDPAVGLVGRLSGPARSAPAARARGCAVLGGEMGWERFAATPAKGGAARGAAEAISRCWSRRECGAAACSS